MKRGWSPIAPNTEERGEDDRRVNRLFVATDGVFSSFPSHLFVAALDKVFRKAEETHLKGWEGRGGEERREDKYTVCEHTKVHGCFMHYNTQHTTHTTQHTYKHTIT